MGFKKGNYTPKGICWCIYFFLLTNTFSLIGQSHCPIRVEYEPRETSQIRSANSINEIKFPFFQKWDNLDNLKLSDDSYATVVLPSNKRSTVFKGQNLGFNLPNGSKISGVEVIVEGRTQGLGKVEGQMMRLLDSNGNAIAYNYATEALPIDEDWVNSTDSTDFVWRYGASDDTWGMDFTEEDVNQLSFGYALQIRNKVKEEVAVFIDQIQMVVYFTPLYEICSTHACVPFYVDESDDELVTYEWYIPEGFELISDSEEDAAINIGVSYAEFGEYEICVESFYKQVSLGLCCRKFNYSNCEPALISGNVFFDQNNDSSNNSGDVGLEGVPVNLYSNEGIFVSSTNSDANGDFKFEDLGTGLYYIEVINETDNLVFTQADIGNDDLDSDITGSFGVGTTDLINLTSGDSITSIGAGFNLALLIGDFVWEDLNGDGIQQIDEPGIEGIEIKATSSSSIVYTTTTDATGYYSFSGLTAGDYTIEISAPSQWILTLPNVTEDNADSDFLPDSPLSLSFETGGTVDSIDAGFYRISYIGDFVWLDTNENGIQDEDEAGIPNVILNLMNQANELVQETKSNSEGYYGFDNLMPGSYYIEVIAESRYTPTLYQFDGGISYDQDSDLQDQDGKFISSLFTITSNTADKSFDFGLVEKPATLGGFTYLDGNNNGQYDSTEEFVPEIKVVLYNSLNEKIDSTISDQGGYYIFEDIEPGDYYIVFDLPIELLFTYADQGDDLSDSDVTSNILPGSTNIFSLSPDEENFSISAGYQNKPKVGDFLWLDVNKNGIQEDGEQGFDGLEVELYNEQNELVKTIISGPHPETGASGYYLFEFLDPGNYYIKAPQQEDLEFTIVEASAVGSNSAITNANGNGTSDIFTLAGNDCNLNLDAGYVFKLGSIQGEVWIDTNEDGVQDQDDPLRAGVLINFYNEAGTLLFTRTTNENGQYIFSDLEDGNYYIVFSPIDQFRFTTALTGSDTALDSDVTNAIISGSTSLISISGGGNIEDIDAGLIDGRSSISGQVWIDANGDGIQQVQEEVLPDVKVDLFDLNNSLLASTLTDLGGTYQFLDNLQGTYYIKFTPQDESFINTDANQGNNDTIDDDVTSFFSDGSTDTINLLFFEDQLSINAGYYEYGIIGDQVFIDENENGINDDNEGGINDVTVNLVNILDEVVATTTTAQGGSSDSGYYRFTTVPPGQYKVQFIRPLFYQFVEADQGSNELIDSDATQILENSASTEFITMTSGKVDLSIDAGVFYQIPMESSISGIVWDDINLNGIRDQDEFPISGVSLELLNQNDEVVGTTMSGEDGIYDFDDLSEGFYVVNGFVPSDKVATLSNIGGDDNVDSDFLDIAGQLKTESFFLANFEDISNVDLGLVNKLQVGDFAWEDINNNGVQDNGEPGIEEIEITISNQSGSIIETAMSDENGAYLFENLPAGFYKICVDLPSGFNFAKSNIGADLLDSDVDSTGCTSFMDYTSGGIIQDLDIGFTQNGSIEGIAFIDLNGNGINNQNDSGLDGVIVSLFSESSEFIASVTTSTIDDIPGIFEFNNLKAADYYLVFEYPEEYIFTEPNIGDDSTDSDISGAFGEGSTDLFSIPSGGLVTTIDGGAFLPGSIGDEVWLDENEDGIRDDNEAGVEGIEVIILRSFGVPIDTVKTDSEGHYQFNNLKQGLYFIQFVIPQEYTISPSDQGLDDNIDSDADETGKTPLISLAHGADLVSVDCGIFTSMASLRSVVWNDSNGDGIRQNNEARIPGIKVSLMDAQDNIVKSYTSNSLGLYAFQNIAPGDYKVYVDIEETNYAFTTANMDDNDFIDSDIMETGESEMFESFDIVPQLSVPNVDAGLQEGGMVVSSIWNDINANGLYDTNEISLNDVEISLTHLNGIAFGSINSNDEYENIQFRHVPPGKYYLKYRIKEGWINSKRIGEIEEDNNSDAINFEGVFISSAFEVKSNEVVTYIDAGFYPGSSLSSSVWYDTNANGIQDDPSKNLPQIYATLYDKNGIHYGTRGVNEQGKIEFSGIQKGKYYLKYYSSSPLTFTKHHSNEETNSDVDHSNGFGTTPLFEFDPNLHYNHIDAGLVQHKEWAQKTNNLVATQDETETRNKSIIQQEDLEFDIHPNPSSNYLNLKYNPGHEEGVVSIYTSTNELVFMQKAKDIEQINLSSLHPGIYYVKFELNNVSVIRKLVKIQ